MKAVTVKNLWIVGVVAVVMGGMLVMTARKSVRKPLEPWTIVPDHVPLKPLAIEGIGPFVPYRSQQFTYDFTFRYPKNWVVAELAGKRQRFRQLLIQGPRNNDDTYTVTLSLVVAPIQPAEPYTSFDTLVQTIRARYTRRDDAGRVVVDRSSSVVEHPSRELVSVFQARIPVSPTETRDVTVRQRNVLLERNGSLYQFSFSADVRDYANYERVFEEFLSSLRWNS